MPAKRVGLASGLAVALCAATNAAASVPHTVEPGETLWSIAAESNLTTATLAAANGMSETSPAIEGSTLQIPSESEGAAALAGGQASAATTATADMDAPPAAGGYTVAPGDTLAGVAAAAGTSAEQVAAMNGLAPDAQLIAGTALKLPNGSVPVQSSSSGQAPVAQQADPQATGGSVDASQIQQIAAQNGVPGDLAAAIAWQESGFDNSMVSAANARGVMQVLPGTWSWVEGNIAGRALDPSSPTENVNAGTMYLGQLLRDAGGNEATAIAGYYQGPDSVRSQGMLPETERYVSNVQALRSRFGG